MKTSITNPPNEASEPPGETRGTQDDPLLRPDDQQRHPSSGGPRSDDERDERYERAVKSHVRG